MEDEHNSLLEQMEEEAEARRNVERQVSTLNTQVSLSQLQYNFIKHLSIWQCCAKIKMYKWTLNKFVYSCQMQRRSWMSTPAISKCLKKARDDYRGIWRPQMESSKRKLQPMTSWRRPRIIFSKSWRMCWWTWTTRDSWFQIWRRNNGNLTRLHFCVSTNLS